MVRLLTNPIMVRGGIVFLMAGFAFVLALWGMRRMRRSIASEAELDATAPTLDALPLHLYNTVIQQLKQQKHELQVQTQAEQRRARTSENFSQAVLSNLSSGVLVFGPGGLVKQSNGAAKDILGFASLSGMSADDIFRDASACLGDGASGSIPLAEEVHSVLREGSNRRQAEADYTTPSGVKRHIAVTITVVPGVDGNLLGATCLISDLSEVARIREQQELQGEISREMALDLRTSLATISGYAQQLAGNRDPGLARQLAADIASEAARLDRSIGGFLAQKQNAEGTAAGASSGSGK